jgi:hypothetical protein
MPPLYSSKRLSGHPIAWADKIVTAALQANIHPAFMLALAVTESSLNPSAHGDDGASFGLFQLSLPASRDERADVTTADLLDGDENIRLAMLAMHRTHRQFPGFTYGAYAEAWTLGAWGKFVKKRENRVKWIRMEKAAVDLELTLDLNEVWA